MRLKILALGCGLVLLTAVSLLYIRYAGHRASAASSAPSVGSVSLASRGVAAISTAPGTVGRLVVASGGQLAVSDLRCTRFYAAASVGVCLRPDGPLATYQMAQVSSSLAVSAEIPLVGLPNRARVSPSGHLLAWTVFVTGDSYNNGQFSTRAGILDTVTGSLVSTLEDFAVALDGRAYAAPDVNFWGVTFADDSTFYATMSTHGQRYLVLGSLATQTVRTVVVNVECPSLSPDGTRIAFKEAVGGDPARGWRLSVLTLSSLDRVHLSETRSVDDQATWLDDHTVAYALPRGSGSDVWQVPADGSGTPSVLIPDATSPSPLL